MADHGKNPRAGRPRPVCAGRPALDLTSVRLASAVANYRSLRRAAAAVGLSQSSLSQRIRGLEDSLTVSLFHRSAQGVQLTHAGEAFMDGARRALDLLDRAADAAALSGRGQVGRLTVGLCASLSTGHLRRAIADFKADRPNVLVQLWEGDRGRLADGLIARAIDVAVLAGRPHPGLGEAMSLWREPIYVGLSSAHRLAGRDRLEWRDLEDELFLATPHAAGLPTVVPSPRVQSHAVNRETLLSMVSLGFGLAILTESDLGARPDGVVCLPLDEAGAPVTTPLTAYRDPQNDNPALRRFWGLLGRRRLSAESPPARSRAEA